MVYCCSTNIRTNQNPKKNHKQRIFLLDSLISSGFSYRFPIFYTIQFIILRFGWSFFRRPRLLSLRRPGRPGKRRRNRRERCGRRSTLEREILLEICGNDAFPYGTYMVLIWSHMVLIGTHGAHMVLIWYLYGTYMVLTWYLYGTYSIPYGNYLHIPGSSICYLCLPFKNTRIEPPFLRKNARSSKYSCHCDKLSARVVGYLRRLVGHFRGCKTGLACIYQKKLWFAQKGRACAN